MPSKSTLGEVNPTVNLDHLAVDEAVGDHEGKSLGNLVHRADPAERNLGGHLPLGHRPVARRKIPPEAGRGPGWRNGVDADLLRRQLAGEAGDHRIDRLVADDCPAGGGRTTTGAGGEGQATAAVQVGNRQPGQQKVGEELVLHRPPDGGQIGAQEAAGHRPTEEGDQVVEGRLVVKEIPQLIAVGGVEHRPLVGGQVEFGLGRLQAVAVLADQSHLVASRQQALGGCPAEAAGAANQ